MNVTTIIKPLVIIAVFSSLLISCDPSNPNNPNDQEIITSVVITATEGPNTYQFAYTDPDGNGGNIPTIDTIFLSPLKIYEVSIQLIDETKTPDDTLTNAILAEAEDHQFFYNISGANLTNTYNDADVNALPIGLVVTWTTGSASIGNLVLTLKHQPGIKDGLITTGETDIEISFPISIQ